MYIFPPAVAVSDTRSYPRDTLPSLVMRTSFRFRATMSLDDEPAGGNGSARDNRSGVHFLPFDGWGYQ